MAFFSSFSDTCVLVTWRRMSYVRRLDRLYINSYINIVLK